MIAVRWQTHADASEIAEEVATLAAAAARVAEVTELVHPRHGGYAYAHEGLVVVACYGLTAAQVRQLVRVEQLDLDSIWGDVHGPALG